MKRSLSSSYLFVFAGFGLAGLAAACGGADLGDCPTDSTAQQLAGRTYIENSCAVAGCHGGGSAQDGVSLETLESIRSHADEAYSELESGSMPPTGMAAATDIENARIFLACGAPDVQ